MGKLKLKGGRITELAALCAKAHRAELTRSFLEHLPLDSAVWEEMAPAIKSSMGKKKKKKT